MIPINANELPASIFTGASLPDHQRSTPLSIFASMLPPFVFWCRAFFPSSSSEVFCVVDVILSDCDCGTRRRSQARPTHVPRMIWLMGMTTSAQRGRKYNEHMRARGSAFDTTTAHMRIFVSTKHPRECIFIDSYCVRTRKCAIVRGNLRAVLVYIHMSLTKKPMKPIIKKPMTVLSATFVYSAARTRAHESIYTENRGI